MQVPGNKEGLMCRWVWLIYSIDIISDGDMLYSRLSLFQLSEVQPSR